MSMIELTDNCVDVKPGYRRFDFTSEEYIRKATTEWNPFRPDHARASRESERDRWHGGSFENAVDLYRNGWSQGLKEVAKIRSQIDGVLGTRCAKLETAYEVYGGQPDVGVFLACDPENMIHRRSSDQISTNQSLEKIVSIVVNCSASACSENERISLIRGSITLAVADILESLNYRVEILCGFGAQTGCGDGFKYPEKRQDFYITVKEANQPLDTEKLAFTVCHNAMLRRIGFALYECYGLDNTNSYSTPSEVRDKGDIYIPHADIFQFGNDLNAWVQSAIKILKQAGVELA